MESNAIRNYLLSELSKLLLYCSRCFPSHNYGPVWKHCHCYDYSLGKDKLKSKPCTDLDFNFHVIHDFWNTILCKQLNLLFFDPIISNVDSNNYCSYHFLCPCKKCTNIPSPPNFHCMQLATWWLVNNPYSFYYIISRIILYLYIYVHTVKW